MAMPADKRIVRIAQAVKFPDGTESIAITEAYAYVEDGENRLRQKQGGIYVRLVDKGQARPDAEIVRDLQDVIGACKEFIVLAEAEITRRTPKTAAANTNGTRSS